MKDEDDYGLAIIEKHIYICPYCNKIIGTSDDDVNYYEDVKNCKFCGQKFFIWIDHFPM